MNTGQHVSLPAPTAWPVVTAFGLTLVFAGVVTHIAVSAVGIVVLAASVVGWWREVIPVEQHELVNISDSVRWHSVRASPRAVEHLTAGTAGHRVRIPADIHPYSAGLEGGLVGAVAMALVAIAYGIIAQRSVWYVINLLAAGLVPSLASADLTVLRAFSATGLLVGSLMHIVLSVLVGLLYAVLLPMFPRRAGLWSGLVTPIVWSGLVTASLDIVNPTLNSRIDWTWFFASQIAFGLTCGYIVARTERIETMQKWSLESRAGIEAPREDRRE
jgi:hypothetical protein